MSESSRMVHREQSSRPQFSQPFRQIILMLTVLGLCGAGAFIALPSVMPVFQANPYLNGFILFVFLIGIVACFWQVLQLIGSVRWIEGFATGDYDPDRRPPRILAPLASLLRQRGARMQLNSSSTRSILDSAATRIDEQREITRYIVNLLIFLGLLGTFYGLATTVPAVVDTIRSLAPREGEEGAAVFARLMTGLESQLGGMGVAFASSLLGLAGSLVVGLLELFAGHGQNRFYRELEEWLSSITRVGLSAGDEGTSPEMAMLANVFDHIGEQMETMQQVVLQSENNRAALDERLVALTDAVGEMSRRVAETRDGAQSDQDALALLARIADGQDRMATGQERVATGQARIAEGQDRLVEGQGRIVEGQERIAEGQERIAEGQDRIATGQGQLAAEQERTARVQEDLAKRLSEVGPQVTGEGLDAESRMRLRSIDVQMLRILEEISAGRQESLAELRKDIEFLVETLTRASDKPGSQPPAGMGDG